MTASLRTAFAASSRTRACAGFIALVAALAIAIPMASPRALDEIDWQAINSAPSASHWFGTDSAGRDLFTRCWAGGRVSLAIALLATAVSAAIGIPYGALAGFLGGRVDQAMMRVVDALYALPFVLVVILLVVAFGRNIYLLFIGLGAVSWLDLARIVRGQTLAAREEAYVEAARGFGASQAAVIWRHVLPNVRGPALVYATLTVPGAILAESFISFLGLGVQEPLASWGTLLADGAKEMRSWWQPVFPAALLALTLLAVNGLGDGLRDALERRPALTLRPQRQRSRPWPPRQPEPSEGAAPPAATPRFVPATKPAAVTSLPEKR